MSAGPRLFRFAQVEYPWPLGPPDGRYLLRRPDDSERAEPTHVLVFATLAAPERRRLLRGRPKRRAAPEPDPAPVPTGRATVIDVGRPFPDEDEAGRWLARAGEPDLEAGIAVLNSALHAFRLVSADPYLRPVGRRHALVARLGFGAGEQVADGHWTQARELIAASRRQRRASALQPQARLAAVLGGREPLLVSEELALRARVDLDQGREREAALQLQVALDAALAELQLDPVAATMSQRLDELRAQREAVAGAAQSALAGPLEPPDRETVAFTLGRIEAALRARALAQA
ncbi:MAG: hypothetical protein JO342_13195 [Solirubrobacterales bacterium]|nr:hypothetical protein [Solirubrobacterales bacterium]